MKKRFMFLCQCLGFAVLPLFAQNGSPAEDTVFVISSVDFNITGRTRPEALIDTAEFRTGEEIQGVANLEKYIRNKTQILRNQRIFKDTATVEYTIGECRDDGKYPVALLVSINQIPGRRLSANSKISFADQYILASGGFEIIVFPEFMRSFYIRASLAWNIIEQINSPNGNIGEIFIGIGHHY
jgi:hypothetical protein